jgi:hypothetical protein
MRLPAIIGTIEIFDLADLQALAAEINSISPGANYVAHLIEADGTSGDDDQDVGFLVDTSRVQVNSVTQIELPGCVGTAATCNTFINPNNNQPELLNDRPPLVLNANVDPSGANIPVIVVVNHLRSFIDIELVTGEGPRVRAKRKAQAEFLANLLQDLQTNNPLTSVISVGDYNAFQFSDGYTDPVATIKGNPTPDDQIVVDQSPDLVNPDFFNLTDTLPASERYSFIFEGTPQALDHVILNRYALVRSTRYAVARFNSDFPETPSATFAGNASRPERASDHDAVVAYFDLTLSPTAAPATISGRVTTPDGAPLGGVAVYLTGSHRRRTITDSNGFYRFADVETESFYTVSPSLANYSFSPAERSFSLLADKTDAVFTAIPDSSAASNPLDTEMFFVRQHYLDFLGREPDQGGLEYWSDQLDQCKGDAACLLQRRIGISAAFFIESEFQETGSFVYRLYKAGLGRDLRYAEFSADRAQVIAGPQLEQHKAALTSQFVQRAEFVNRYSQAASAESFVDTLLASVRSSTGADLSARRTALLESYQRGGSQVESRSQVLRAVVEEQSLREAVYNSAFVRMQYFGYLRRDPDEGGYLFWMNVLNNREPGNYRGMVCAFLTSREYQLRFSLIVRHTNQECGQ